MTFGVALLTIAIGAILKFAVTANVAGLDIATVGVILMIVGTAGLVIGLGLTRGERRIGRSLELTSSLLKASVAGDTRSCAGG